MQCINPPTPLAAGGARQRRHYKQPVARNDDTANCKSQREGSRQRRKQGARASEQGGNKRDKEDESKATDSSIFSGTLMVKYQRHFPRPLDIAFSPE